MEFSDYVFKITINSSGSSIWFCPPDGIMAGSLVDYEVLTNPVMMRMLYPEVSDQITEDFLKTMVNRDFENVVWLSGVCAIYNERDREWL